MNCKILACATDAGGLANIIYIANELARRGAVVHLVTSRKFKSNCNHKIKDSIIIHHTDIKKIDELNASYNFIYNQDVLVVGTTGKGSLEQNLTVKLRGKIKSIAILDEWFNYRIRFQGSGGFLKYLPDWVIVPDNMARAEAISEGLPRKHCIALGCPSIGAMTRRIKEFRIHPPKEPKIINVGAELVITFLSETHSLDYGSKPGESGRMGKFIGYTESAVRQKLIDIIKKINLPIHFIDKLHPSDNSRNNKTFKDIHFKYSIIKNCDLHSLLWHSKVVIGMRSMALLESALIPRDTYAFQPGLIDKQRCTAVRLGFAADIRDASSMECILETTLKNKTKCINRHNISRLHFQKKHLNAVSNIVNFIQNKA